MNSKTHNERLGELETLIEYGCPEKQRHQVSSLAQKYEKDTIAIQLLHSFYSFLPEAEDEAVERIAYITSRQGLFLLCIETHLAKYLYLVSVEEAIFLGRLESGIHDAEVVAFFKEETLKKLLKKDMKTYKPASEDISLCPVCHTGKGEFHILGCPVEICPSCGGQLTRCNCKFDHLDRPRITRDSHIDKLHEIMATNGRVPFNPTEHSPVYHRSNDKAG